MLLDSFFVRGRNGHDLVKAGLCGNAVFAITVCTCGISVECTTDKGLPRQFS